ncbi:hypothetical protein ACFQZZ_11860 [Nocardia sp. GCM10030253]|uniref:hypothetical protein n=1 Tax=Nocardia sp. GCM10030253 TaxID=3273404 RepID=UPI00363EEB18
MERARPITRERDRKDPRNRNRTAQLDPDRSPRTTPPGRDHRTPSRIGRTVIGGLAITGAFLLAGCDSAVGIPNDEPTRATAQTTTPPAATPSTPSTSALPPIPANAPQVTAVPGLPAAAPAVQRWAVDLQTDTITELQAKCWTMAPGNVAEMYDNSQAILNALTQPGVATEDTVTWKSRTTTVTIDRAAVDTGYACPRVVPAGGESGLNDADARHTVRRYLARSVGTPLDPADKEGAHPLVCKANPPTWDPTGTGKPVAAPLANNTGKLTGATKFADQEIRSERLRADYIAVQVPVTNSSGLTQTRTFTLTEGSEGYCIGDVSP